MSDVLWFDKKPGDPLEAHDLSPAQAGLAQVILGPADYVRVPAHVPGFAGRVLSIVGRRQAPCPNTGVVCEHLDLEQGLHVACNGKEFVWYTFQLEERRGEKGDEVGTG